MFTSRDANKHIKTYNTTYTHGPLAILRTVFPQQTKTHTQENTVLRHAHTVWERAWVRKAMYGM